MEKLPRDIISRVLEDTPSCGFSLFKLVKKSWNVFKDNPKQLQNYWQHAIQRDFPVFEMRNQVDNQLTFAIQNGKSLEQLYFKRFLTCYFPNESHNKAITFTNLYNRLPPSARIALAAAQGDFATIISELAKHFIPFLFVHLQFLQNMFICLGQLFI